MLSESIRARRQQRPPGGAHDVKILMATSEAVPFAKTGGLADVCGALPVELARLGHEADADPARLSAGRAPRACRSSRPACTFDVADRQQDRVAAVSLRADCPTATVPVYLVEQDEYFDRAGLYQENGEDYIDNCERFVFFSRAVLESVRLLDLQVDVLHANDWQTGLIPAYLKIEYRGVPALRAASPRCSRSTTWPTRACSGTGTCC